MSSFLLTDATRSTSAARASAESGALVKYLRIGIWLFALAIAASQAWTSRNTISTDGISYLEMGDAFAHGNPSALVNGYWSGLYPAAIGTLIATVHPAPRDEFATVHAVNFAMFVFAFACFEFFLRSLLAACRSVSDSLPEWFLQITGYTVFLWTSLHLITVAATSPDLTMSAFVFLAAGILVRIGSGAASLKYFLFLGLVLGFGYIAKAPLFLLSFVFLTAAGILVWKQQMPARKMVIALLGFAVIAGPMVAALSISKHRLTFGDSGRLNYAWYVDGASYRHWQGEPLGVVSADVAPRWTAGPVSTGVPVHPTRKVLDTPPVYEFGGTIGGTYPVWADPSYWNEGLLAPFDTKQQLRKLVTNAKSYYALLFNPHFGQLIESGHAYQILSPLIILLWFALIALGARVHAQGMWRVAVPVVLPPLAAFAMYLVVYSEPRHLGVFVALLYIGSFATLRMTSRLSMGTLKIAAAALVIAYVFTSVLPSLRALPEDADDSNELQVAEGFHQLGFPDGTKIASLIYSNPDHVKWARLARARIVAEMFQGAYTLSEDSFWKASETQQAAILQAFAKSGAEALVSKRMPEGEPPSGWQRIGQTQYFVLRIPHA